MKIENGQTTEEYIMTKFYFNILGLLFFIGFIFDLFLIKKDFTEHFFESFVNLGYTVFFWSKSFRTYIIEMFKSLNKKT